MKRTFKLSCVISLLMGLHLMGCTTDDEQSDPDSTSPVNTSPGGNNGQPTTPGGQPTTPGGQPTTPGGQPTTPGGQPTTPSAQYPAGPYGYQEGDTIGAFQFEGYRDGQGAWTKITMNDYHDPDGSKGINALFITLGKPSCGACNAEAEDMNEWKAEEAANGVRFLSALFRDNVQTEGGSWAATQATVDAWIDEHNVTYDMVIDPEGQLNNNTWPEATPLGYLVNPRTMTIYKRYNGAPGFLYGLDQLLEETRQGN